MPWRRAVNWAAHQGGGRCRRAADCGAILHHGSSGSDGPGAVYSRRCCNGGQQGYYADELIVCTGARPDLAMLRELRLDLDPAVEATRSLAPLIDPNLHSCGTVRPHGEAELRQPEKDFYIIGMKSYGRAPTFLMATGYEQARSVVAALCGDWEAARAVRLNLPETGVCVTDLRLKEHLLRPGCAACPARHRRDSAGPRP